MDDPFMTKVFEDDIERTQLILRIILENDTIKVKKVSTQKRLKTSMTGFAARYFS